MDAKEQKFWEDIRQALLLIVDHIENKLSILTTAEIRRRYKNKDE